MQRQREIVKRSDSLTVRESAGKLAVLAVCPLAVRNLIKEAYESERGLDAIQEATAARVFSMQKLGVQCT